jgi:hypothetical protein
VVTGGAWARRLWFNQHYLQPRFNSVEAVTYAVASPDERLHAELSFAAAGGAAPRWRVHHDNRDVVELESLALTLADSRKLGSGAQIIGQQLTRLHENVGSDLTGECNELAVQLLDGATGIMFDIMVRAYDAGVAQCYLLRYNPQDEALQPLTTPWRVVCT